MEDESQLTIEVLNVLFKVLQGYEFQTSIPEDIIEVIKEYIDSRRITVQLRKKKQLEIGWNQDGLLVDLVTLSAKLFESRIESHFKEVHIETRRKWFLDNMKTEGKYGESLSSKLEVMTEIILNQEKYLPGFKYFYEFGLDEKDDKNEGQYCGDLLFVSEVGILAVVRVNKTKDKTYIKDEIRNFKSLIDKRFGNLFVAVIGLYTTNVQNGKITLNPIDSFDKKIAKKVKEYAEDKHEMMREESLSTDFSSDSSYSDLQEEEIFDSDSNDDDDGSLRSNRKNNLFDFLKSITRFIIFVFILDLISKIFFNKEID